MLYSSTRRAFVIALLIAALAAGGRPTVWLVAASVKRFESAANFSGNGSSKTLLVKLWMARAMPRRAALMSALHV